MVKKLTKNTVVVSTSKDVSDMHLARDDAFGKK